MAIVINSVLPGKRRVIRKNIFRNDNAPLVILRAFILIHLAFNNIKLRIEGNLVKTVSRDTRLMEPGDIAGIDSKVILKVKLQNRFIRRELDFLPYTAIYEKKISWHYIPAKVLWHSRWLWMILLVLKALFISICCMKYYLYVKLRRLASIPVF